LANRRYFDARLAINFQQALESQTPLAVVMVDVDEFKKYNDLYGHLGGDDCLQRIAQALRTAVLRSTDLVARYGGEEMVLLLPGTDADGALEVAQRARLAVVDLQIPHAAAVLGTVSISLGARGAQYSSGTRSCPGIALWRPDDPAPKHHAVLLLSRLRASGPRPTHKCASLAPTLKPRR
jgi:diguanylate cyclase (GGDEF)-like protein